MSISPEVLKQEKFLSTHFFFEMGFIRVKTGCNPHQTENEVGKKRTPLMEVSLYKKDLKEWRITSPRLIIPTNTPFRSTGNFLIRFFPSIAAISSISAFHAIV